MDVYFLPGIGGSTLVRVNGNRVWLNWSDLILGRFGLMKLAPDGVLADSQLGTECRAVADPFNYEYYGTVYPYYTDVLKWLFEKGSERGWTVIPYPYDWRKNTVVLGSYLAIKILERSKNNPEPCTIVAHSMGGLVARCAYRHLLLAGRADLIRRIVCLGTPHRGSYYMLENVLVAVGSESRNIMYTNTFSPYIFRVPLKPVSVKKWTADDMANLFLTWPSVYELLPHLGGPDAADDPQREELWKLENYPAEWQWQQKHRRYCLDRYHALMRSPETLPPKNVLVNVYSNAFDTHAAMRKWVTLRESPLDHVVTGLPVPVYEPGGDGDSVVPRNSAVLDGYPSEAIIATHSGLPDAACQGDRLLHYIEYAYDEPEPVQVPIRNGDRLPDKNPPWPVSAAASLTQPAVAGCLTDQCPC